MNEFADFHERPSAMEALEMAHEAMRRFMNPEPIKAIGFKTSPKLDSESALSLAIYASRQLTKPIEPVEIGEDAKKIIDYLDHCLKVISQHMDDPMVKRKFVFGKKEDNGKSSIW